VRYALIFFVGIALAITGCGWLRGTWQPDSSDNHREAALRQDSSYYGSIQDRYNDENMRDSGDPRK